MSEKERKVEELATPEQAQAVLDEVDRITKDIKLKPGNQFNEYDPVPVKISWKDKLTIYRYPDGEINMDDPNSINLSTISWNNNDGSRTSFGVELSTERGMHLTKHIYPTSLTSKETMEQLNNRDFAAVAAKANALLDSARSDHEARVAEREMGLHLASSTEAQDLIARLEQMTPASDRGL